MSAHLSILQLVTAVVFALASAVWALGVIRIRHDRLESAARQHGGTLRSLPAQRRGAPPWESVELTPAERDAFAVLVRRFGETS
ncbi:hypothetical protein [Streptomyces sp. NPDC007264]|uniref:hypothetical protein n=1 Tax=Streptomyces sp. NPDC007264 TaxID=3364777 RepID=UPI0036DF5697